MIKESLEARSDGTPSPFQGEGRGEGLYGGETSYHPRNLELKNTARKLRRSMTDVEKKFWYQVRDRRFMGIKFRRQYPIGAYVADFICVEHKLIIELDGGQHAQNQGRDIIRDRWLADQGYRTLRFWNNDVLQNFEGVMETLRIALTDPHPSPLPERERGFSPVASAAAKNKEAMP